MSVVGGVVIVGARYGENDFFSCLLLLPTVASLPSNNKYNDESPSMMPTASFRDAIEVLFSREVAAARGRQQYTIIKMRRA